MNTTYHEEVLRVARKALPHPTTSNQYAASGLRIFVPDPPPPIDFRPPVGEDEIGRLAEGLQGTIVNFRLVTFACTGSLLLPASHPEVRWFEWIAYGDENVSTLGCPACRALRAEKTLRDIVEAWKLQDWSHLRCTIEALGNVSPKEG